MTATEQNQLKAHYQDVLRDRLLILEITKSRTSLVTRLPQQGSFALALTEMQRYSCGS